MLNATVLDSQPVTTGLFRLFVKPDSGVPSFLAGQSVALGMPDPARPEHLIKRAYSIASPPTERSHLEFYITVVPDGELTPHLELLQESDRLFVHSRAVGTFTLEHVPQDAPLFFLSTGTGVAPFMSFVRDPAIHSRPVTLVHGVRTVDELGYHEILQELTRRYPDFRYIPSLSREVPDGWSGEIGRIQKLIEDGKITPNAERDHIFLCGNSQMTADLSARFTALNFREDSRRSPGNLHLEAW